jgi:very-short-patch-repair endonuclease
MDDIAIIPMAADGLFTTGQARAAGLGKRRLQDLVKRGSLDHVCRGVYARHEPGLSPEARHLRLVRAGVLLYPDAVISHVSAVLAHGLPVVDHSLQRAALTRPVDKEVLTASFRIRPLGQGRLETPHGPAVGVAAAVVHFTLDAGVMPGVVAADHALHHGLMDVQGLEAAAATVSGWPRSGRAQTMLSMVDSRSESVGESRLRVHMQVAGVTLVPQVVIRDHDGEFVARVDFVVEGTKVVVEFDGKVKYGDGNGDVLFQEKLREDRLRRLGYTVIRVTWDDLRRPERILAWIRQATAAA